MTFREDFCAKLKNYLIEDENIFTAWVGGSAATGFLDEFSDLDLCIICADEYVDAAFEKLITYIKQNYGLGFNKRLPEPCWHGHSQGFYKPLNAPEYFYIDVLVEKQNTKSNRLMEENRHGKADIWFDKLNMFNPEPMPKQEIDKKIEGFLAMVNIYNELFELELNKAIARKQKIEAHDLYNRLLARYAGLLGIKHRPAKQDFGLRYIGRDYAEEDAEFIANMMYVSDFNDLKNKAKILQQKCNLELQRYNN